MGGQRRGQERGQERCCPRASRASVGSVCATWMVRAGAGAGSEEHLQLWGCGCAPCKTFCAGQGVLHKTPNLLPPCPRGPRLPCRATADAHVWRLPERVVLLQGGRGR